MMHCFHLTLSLFTCLVLSTSQEAIPSFKLPLQRRKTGISAVQSSIFQWDANVTIGGQNVILELDTGSSFLWVLDASLSALNASNRGTYDFNKSRTASLQDETFVITYGSGTVGGRMITETVTIGGLTFSNVSMGITNSSTPYFLEQPYVGVLGLGPQPTNAQALPVPFSTSEMPSFALDFQTAGSNHSGSIDFGGIDHSKYAGQLARAPLNSTGGHFAIDSVDFSIGNVRRNTKSHVILDTGAGHDIIVPSSVAKAYYSQVPGAVLADPLGQGLSTWLTPCSAILPNLTLHIGNSAATVAGTSMVQIPVNTSTSTTYCSPSVQKASAIPNLLGFPFFACNYVVFDRRHGVLGWAEYA